MQTAKEPALTRRLNEAFRRFASKVARFVGSSWIFIMAVMLILVWALTGPMFGFSDTWQLIINTGTTIVTFLMVFLIQNTQNRDARAIHLKLDELLRSVENARTSMIDLESLSDEELDVLHEQFQKLLERSPSKSAIEELEEKIEQEKEEREQESALASPA